MYLFFVWILTDWSAAYELDENVAGVIDGFHLTWFTSPFLGGTTVMGNEFYVPSDLALVNDAANIGSYDQVKSIALKGLNWEVSETRIDEDQGS